MQTKWCISMCLRSLKRKRIPSLCIQKQMCGTKQCVNCANTNSIQTMANLDLLRQGCLLFSVFLETEEVADSGQEKGQTSLYKIFTYTLNMLNVKAYSFSVPRITKKVKSERVCVLRLTASSFFPIQLVFLDCKVCWVALFPF